MRGGRANKEDGGATAEQDVPAVAYVRMSTDHQKYSTENQLDVIRSYAAARGLQILRVFEEFRAFRAAARRPGGAAEPDGRGPIRPGRFQGDPRL